MKLNENVCAVDKNNKIDSFSRVQCAYKDLSVKYRHKSKDFLRQFAYIYAARLNTMRDKLVKQCHKKWGENVRVARLVELAENNDEKCVIIGTLFKDQQLKPSILKEISEELNIVPQPPRSHFTSDSDKLILEDELQRIMLLGKLDVHSVVTGVICAVLGKEDQAGKFNVEDVCYTGTTPLLSTPQSFSSDRYVVLLSGVDMSGNGDLFSVQLMVDWLTGWLGDSNDQEEQSRVGRVVIAGNAVRATAEPKHNKVVQTFSVEETTTTLSAVEQLDIILEQMVGCVPVDLMPGEFDPTNHSLPQQPLHYCMFPKASRYETFKGVPNPYCFDIDGRLVVGTSGQPIDDIGRYSNIDNRLSILENTLRWAHLCPTAPDTLHCYPYYNEDPFILDQQPNIYFAGNQEVFETKLIEVEGENSGLCKTRLVCIPSFAKTTTCVVVNLSTLDCYPLTFGVTHHNSVPDK